METTSDTECPDHGADALRLNNTGIWNTAVGSGAGFQNSSGRYNTVVGAAALFDNASGNSNTAIGVNALLHNLNGSNNTVVGYSALAFDRSGSFNTAVGSNTFLFSVTNSTVIGYGAQVEASNKVRIGNAAVTVIEGQVPFTTPSDGRYKFNVKENVSGLDFILRLRPVTYQFDANKFEVQVREGNDSAKSIPTSMYSAYSEATAVRRSGFIAQEVEKAAIASGYNFSGIIKPKTDKDHYGLSYESFVVPLVKGMQEQQELIHLQNKKIEGLDKQLKVQQKQINELQKKLLELEARIQL